MNTLKEYKIKHKMMKTIQQMSTTNVFRAKLSCDCTMESMGTTVLKPMKSKRNNPNDVE